MPHIFFDGKVIPFEEARVSPDDLGILRGFAVYEGITAFYGIPFHFDAHWKRLENSAEALGLNIPLSRDEAYKGSLEVISKNAGKERAHLRIILSGGKAEGGIEYVSSRSLFYIMAEKAVPLPEILYREGGTLITCAHERFMPEHKTTSYITGVMLQKKRKDAGAIEILYTNEEDVLECATSNICVVKDGIIVTPRESILKGITRSVALMLAKEKGHIVEERLITISELLDADEVFITSSFKDIVPIVKIDETIIGSGLVGKVTKDVLGMYKTATEA